MEESVQDWHDRGLDGTSDVMMESVDKHNQHENQSDGPTPDANFESMTVPTNPQSPEADPPPIEESEELPGCRAKVKLVATHRKKRY